MAERPNRVIEGVRWNIVLLTEDPTGYYGRVDGDRFVWRDKGDWSQWLP
jgi:hypothetical protein